MAYKTGYMYLRRINATNCHIENFVHSKRENALDDL